MVFAIHPPVHAAFAGFLGAAWKHDVVLDQRDSRKTGQRHLLPKLNGAGSIPAARSID